MDRLPAVIAVCALAAACGDDGDRGGKSRERVNAVRAAPAAAVDPAAMCDVFHGAGKGPAFTWPALTADAPPAVTDRWQWINVWATWCKPCVEELPRLRAWQTKLGARVALKLVSADDSDEAVAAFRDEHPSIQGTARLADAGDLTGWLSVLGVAGGSLPVHVFVAPDGKVRCVRASAVEETDYPAIDALLR